MLKLLDLFAGMGGLSTGFSREGYRVYGIDINRYTLNIYRVNSIGEAKVGDLRTVEIMEIFGSDFDVVAGGPPCRPWSSVNLKKRGREHEDYDLMKIFFHNVKRILPPVFIMENVPPARDDALKMARVISSRYSIAVCVIPYSDFGAPVRRRRMFMVGFRKDSGIDAMNFLKILDRFRKKPATVKEAIGKDYRGDPDHVFPRLKTIRRYEKYYRTGKYGWYILKWDEPAPSFGNIMKTYILHPDSVNGNPPRVISVREAMSIMGFPDDFHFPEGMPVGLRYQMVADAVSPVFSRVLAKTLKIMLSGEVNGREQNE